MTTKTEPKPAEPEAQPEPRQIKLTVGRIVQVYVDQRSNNGGDVAPAIITRVWGGGMISDATPYANVNWRLVLDHSSNDQLTNEWRTSVMVFATQADVDAYLAYTAEQNYPDGVGGAEVNRLAFISGRKAAGAIGWMPARV